MLLDVIIWLPTLFTYVLFLLILVILFFIVAYVSHKIYISIYDNLPLPAAPGRSRSTMVRSEQIVNQNQLSARSFWIPNRSAIFESSVVRITISLEPCYLVNLELDIQPRTRERPVSLYMCNCQLENVSTCAATVPRDPSDMVRINKYYTHMSNIPRLKILLKCNERSNMRLVLDDVIQDVMEARCTDSGGACRRPKMNSKSSMEPSVHEVQTATKSTMDEPSVRERHMANSTPASKPSVDESERAGPSCSSKKNCCSRNSSSGGSGQERREQE